MILDMTQDNFYEVIVEASRVGVSVDYNGNNYSLSTDAFKESGCVDIYATSNGTECDLYDIYLEIDNPRSLKSIRQALIKYFKENK